MVAAMKTGVEVERWTCLAGRVPKRLRAMACSSTGRQGRQPSTSYRSDRIAPLPLVVEFGARDKLFTGSPTESVIASLPK